ncbi:hypothetical protein DRJ19_02820 [Candidatus Woesearchaeota archaeon]|nr:MAG: hypothetical protein DRJ19_02820 [Candidatus Woesearchaeota archaeon]
MQVVRARGYDNRYASFILDRGIWGWPVEDNDTDTLDLFKQRYEEAGVGMEIIEGVNPADLVWYRWDEVDDWVCAPFYVLREYHRILAVERDRIVVQRENPKYYNPDFHYLPNEAEVEIDRLVEEVAERLARFPRPISPEEGEPARRVAVYDEMSSDGSSPFELLGYDIRLPYTVVLHSRPSAWHRRLEWEDGDGERMVEHTEVRRAIRRAVIGMARKLMAIGCRLDYDKVLERRLE